MLIGSLANGLNSGRFCAGSRIVVDLQRIKGTSFVFSAPVPALLAVFASEGINILRNTEHAFYPEHFTGEGARDSRCTRLYRLAHDPLTRCLTNHPHPPMYRDAVVDCCGRRHKGTHEVEMSEAVTPVRYLQSISNTQSSRVLRRIYFSNAYSQLSMHQLVGMLVYKSHSRFFTLARSRCGVDHITMSGGTHWT